MANNVEKIAAVTPKTGFTGEDIKVLRDLSFEDIIKMQIISCSNVANNNPENFSISVSLLEQLLWDEMPEEYHKEIEKVEEQARKIFPMWQSKDDQFIQMKNYIALRKFRFLVSHLKKRIPAEIITNIP